MDTKISLQQQLAQQSNISLGDFPDIELYMDQVLTYVGRTQLSQRESEKLTAAMVNNYIKDGLLPRASGKKYSSQHLAYLIVISKLKQVLSVKDTGTLIQSGLNAGGIEGYFDEFKQALGHAAGRVESELENADESPAYTALKLALLSYFAKAACERLLDELAPAHPPAKDKAKAAEKPTPKTKAPADPKKAK